MRGEVDTISTAAVPTSDEDISIHGQRYSLTVCRYLSEADDVSSAEVLDHHYGKLEYRKPLWQLKLIRSRR